DDELLHNAVQCIILTVLCLLKRQKAAIVYNEGKWTYILQRKGFSDESTTDLSAWLSRQCSHLAVAIRAFSPAWARQCFRHRSTWAWTTTRHFLFRCNHSGVHQNRTGHYQTRIAC